MSGAVQAEMTTQVGYAFNMGEAVSTGMKGSACCLG